MSALGRLLIAGAGAAAARYALREARTSPAGPALERTNFRGRTVSLAAGPALAAGGGAAGGVGAPGGGGRGGPRGGGLGAGGVGR
ncbi:hypothetical protein AB0B48_33085, partial [Micromonospora sp. NPDC049089]